MAPTWTNGRAWAFGERETTTIGGSVATGANDVLVVQGRAAGDQEILIPFVADSVILDVDVAAGVISVNWEWD